MITFGEIDELVLMITNDGREVTSTNYFDSKLAQAGFVFGSWNAGALRLLIPETQLPAIEEMQGAKNVPVTLGHMAAWGRHAVEVLFDDGTDCPFALYLVPENMDRRLDASGHGKTIEVRAYTRAGLLGTWPGRFRVSGTIPCLKPIGWMPKRRE